MQMFLAIKQLLNHMFKNEITRLKSVTESVIDGESVDAKGYVAMADILIQLDPGCTGEQQ